MIPVDEASRQISALHRTHGGSTFNVYFGDLSGEPLYAVSVYPERSRILSQEELDPEIVQHFIVDNLDLLEDPRNNVGTWLNRDDGDTYLDVASALPSREQAVGLARRYNQIGIFDLRVSELLEIGGTGGPPSDLPPLEQRLPDRGAS